MSATLTPPAPAQPHEADAHPILTGAEWVLSAVRGPGSPDVIHGAQCVMCAQTSVHSKDDGRSIGAWAVAHTRDNPLHQDYVKITRERWRVHPCGTSAVPAATSASAPASVEVPTSRPAAPAERDGGVPREGRPRHARSLPTWRLVLCVVVWSVMAGLGRGWSRASRGGPETRNPCLHRELDPVTRKCKECGAQIFLPKPSTGRK